MHTVRYCSQTCTNESTTPFAVWRVGSESVVSGSRMANELNAFLDYTSRERSTPT